MSRQDRRDALDVIQPAAPRSFVAGFILFPSVPEGRARGADPLIAAPLDMDAGALRNHRWQDETLVVIGVFADEVNAAGCLGRCNVRHRRRPAPPVTPSLFLPARCPQ